MNITEHNKKIRAMRRKGELPPFGMTTHTMELERLKNQREKKVKNYSTINRLLRIKEAAYFLGVHENTLRRWDSILQPLRIGERSDRRYDLEKLKEFIMTKDNDNGVYLSENGSVLPHKFACWPYPFDEVTEKDE